MTDAQLALLVLILLYLWECLLWLRRDAACFVPRWDGRGNMKVGGGMYGTDGKAIVLTHPMPRWSESFICQQWPLSLSPEGVFSYVAQAFNPGNRPRQTERFIEWEKLSRIEFTGDLISANGQALVRTASPVMARFLAGLLRRVKETPPAQRDRIIREAIRGFVDPGGVAIRLGEYRSIASTTRWLCDALFVFAFGICPLVIYRVGLLATWDMLLVTLILLMSATTVAWRRAQLRLYPHERSDRTTHTITIATFPPATMRAGSLLSQHALATFHPLAIARTLCSKDDFREIAGGMIRDLHLPIEPVCGDCPPPAARTESHFRELLREEVSAMVASAGLDVATLLALPAPDDESSKSCCPRCHTQFLLDSGACEACGGLVLQPLTMSVAGR